MDIFAFILGRETKIALAELESVLRRFSFYFNKNYPERVRLNEDESKGGNYSILSLQDNVAIIKTKNCNLSAENLINQLGGTIKIFEIIDTNPKFKTQNQKDGINHLIINELKNNQSSGTLNFGISDYSGEYNAKQLSEVGIKIKIQARKIRPVRFVAGKEAVLSSATSYHKIHRSGGEEFGIFANNPNYNIENFGINHSLKIGNCKIDNLLIGKLLAVSNPDEWSKRDYDKPAGDKYSGMMPPKLARMMVNIALNPTISNIQYPTCLQAGKVSNEISNSNSQIKYSDIDHSLPCRGSELAEEKIGNCKIENSHKTVVLDPFCGSGNILMEAKMLGCEIMGSDLLEKAVEDTKANIRWLMSNVQFPITNENQKSKIKNQNCNSKVKNINNSTIQQFNNIIFQADATSYNFSKKLQANKLIPDTCNLFIVTEPYLGKPKKVKVERDKVKGEIEELKNLYLAFFKNLLNLSSVTNNLQAITFVFPIIETLNAGDISLYNECVDEIVKMGYNPQCTLRYGRDYQVIKREIVLLQPRDRRT